MRDALSILDRAIAFGEGKIAADTLRDLLGLADRARIFDLLETVLKGDAGGALTTLDQLNKDGAEPGQVVTDLADAVHAVTVVKAAGLASADPATSEAERARIEDLAGRLSMPVLARAWQMLLKGHDEVRNSPRPQAAADMVLVRLAYAADLPPPGELARQLKEGSAGGNGAARSAPSAPERTPARTEARDDVQAALQGEQDKPRDAARDTPPPESENPAPPSALPAPQSFEDLVALADDKRDLKLKNALLEQVRLVHFKPGNIELNPLPAAPPNSCQELMRKLKAWTGRVWIVAVSDQEGAETLGAQRARARPSEIEQVRAHPAVQEVLAAFSRCPHRRGAAHRASGARRRWRRGARKQIHGGRNELDEEFRADDEAGAGAPRPHGRHAGRNGADPVRGPRRRRHGDRDPERQRRDVAASRSTPPCSSRRRARSSRI